MNTSDLYSLMLGISLAAFDYIAYKHELDTFDKSVNRKQIFDLLQKKKLTISQIHREIKLSYQSTFAHIKYLEDLGLVRCEKQEKQQGRSVVVIVLDININKLLDIRKQQSLKHLADDNPRCTKKQIKELLEMYIKAALDKGITPKT